MANFYSFLKSSILKIDFLSLSASLCILTLPWSIKINTLTIIAFSVGLVLYTMFTQRTIVIKPKQFLIATVVIIVAMGWLVITTHLDVGFKYVERSLSALIFPLVFSIVFNQYRLNINYILVSFLISCFLRYLFFIYDSIEFELIFIIDYWKEILIQFNQLFKLHGLHPSYFSMFLGFCSLVSYNYIIESKTILKRIFWVFSTLIFFVFNLSLTSKMPLIASIFSLIFVVSIQLIKSSDNKKLIKVGSLLFCILFAAGFYLKKVPNAISQDLNNYYNAFIGQELSDIYDYNQYGLNSSLDTWEKTNRIHIWKSSLEIVSDNVFFGVGTGDINSELNKKFYQNDQEYLATKDTNSHNQILDYLIKYGFIGFTFISIAFSFYFKTAWKYEKSIYLMFLVLSCCCMMTENILNRQYGIVFFFFLNSMFYFSGLSSSSKLNAK